MTVVAALLSLCCLSCGGDEAPGQPGAISPSSQPSPGVAAGMPTSRPSPVYSGGRPIRVRLARDLTTCRVTPEGAFDLIDTETRKVLHHVEAARPVTIVFDRAGIALPGLNMVLPVTLFDLVPCDNTPVSLHLDTGERRYLGDLRFARNDEGLGSVINVIDIEAYLASVVASELHERFHAEAFRAQAIASRTYAWYHMNNSETTRDWDVTASESYQVYGDLDRSSRVPQAAEAVEATRGIVCSWDSPHGNRIFCTYYSSTCGGHTRPAEPNAGTDRVEPLRGNVECPYCRSSPAYRWDPVTVSRRVISHRLREKYERFRDMGHVARMEVTLRTPGGRPLLITFHDLDDNSIELDAESVRLTIDPTGREIRSSYFVLIDEGNDVTFASGRGFGHGIGMCQYGADTLAVEGWSADRILQHYYPTSRLTRAY